MVQRDISKFKMQNDMFRHDNKSCIDEKEIIQKKLLLIYIVNQKKYKKLINQPLIYKNRMLKSLNYKKKQKIKENRLTKKKKRLMSTNIMSMIYKKLNMY